MIPASRRAAPWANAPRLCLIASLALCWANYLLTTRWASVPGSIHGSKEPWFVLALGASSLLALTLPVGRRIRLGSLAAIAFLAGLGVLAASFWLWFPPQTWREIPFLDNWPARYQSTVDQIALFHHGAVVGWQWAFLGGYHLSSDLTVSLAAVAAIPVWLLGPQVGFHLTHLLLFAAVPALVWLDLRHESDRDLKWLASGVTAVLATNYSYFLLRSGDTNSLAGVVATTAALVAAGRLGHSRWAGPALVLSLSLVTYTHAGFLLFAGLFLATDIVVTRQWRRAPGIAVAMTAALVAGLPLTWESFRYPEWFTLNNAVLEQPSFHLAGYLRKVFYNTELLVLPGRWFNDYTGLAALLIPVLALVATRGTGRARVHACWALLTIGLVRLYDPQHLGLGLLRPIHMHVVFLGPVIGWTIAAWAGHRALAMALLATVALYIQMHPAAVPHVQSVRQFDAALVDRLATLDGALVLIENSYHAEMDVDPRRRSPPAPFPVHFEALLPAVAGQRFYAGVWDGWQWSPARRHLLANGSLGGRRVDTLGDGAILHELRRWGVRHCLVWSQLASDRFERIPQLTARWTAGRWTHFELRDADAREVMVPLGEARLAARTPLSARVELDGVAAGATVTVRTNFYPAWQAFHDGRRVVLQSNEGQLSFHAPAGGRATILLEYPRYRWTLLAAVVALLLASGALWASTSRMANGLVQAPSYGSGKAT